MKLSYIILTESGERLNISEAWSYINPNDRKQPEVYSWVKPSDPEFNFGLIWYPADCVGGAGCLFTTDPNDSEPIMAMSVPFQAFSADGVLLFDNADSVPFWL